MKTKIKKILTVAAVVAVTYTVGKCKGMIQLRKEIDKELEKKTNLEIGELCYRLDKNKVTVELVNREEKSEEEKSE